MQMRYSGNRMASAHALLRSKTLTLGLYRENGRSSITVAIPNTRAETSSASINNPVAIPVQTKGTAVMPVRPKVPYIYEVIGLVSDD